MADRDLILGVLAAQAGFVTPAQVMAAASARMLARDGRSLLDTWWTRARSARSGVTWSPPSPTRLSTRTVEVRSGWSANGSIIIVTYEGAGAVLLDARSGEELARIYEGRSGSAAPEVNVHPGLRFRMSRTDRSWQLFPLPGPDTSSPAESFRRALDETGFQMRGVELEVASP